MLLSLSDLSQKSLSLYSALDSQFKKNAALGAAKTMSVSGSIQIKPKVDGIVAATPAVPAKPAAATPTDGGVKINVTTDKKD